MRQVMIALTTVAVLVIVGCSGGGASGPLLVVYSSVYGVNALSTDQNITLHVGAETIETVLPYEQNASVIEKAVGSDNLAYYNVGTSVDYGITLLENSRTYFYAATDCNDSLGVEQRALSHIVADDMQIMIVNTSSDPVLTTDINISVDGVQVNPGDTKECDVTSVATPSAKDQNISVIFSGGSPAVWKVLPADVSADIVVYGTPPQEAAIIPLPRLTTDAL